MISEHHATVSWERTAEPFTYEAYSRDHSWTFPGGGSLPASAAPEFNGDGARVNPEEAFIASVSSCHMLTFLALAARKRLTVDSYRDSAVGWLEKDERDRPAITRIHLRPVVTFSGSTTPDNEQLRHLHDLAHQHCFIANSVKTQVTVELAPSR